MSKGRGVEEVLYSIPGPEQRAVAPKFLYGHHNPHTGLFYAGVKDFFQSFCWLQPQYQGQYGEDIKQYRLKNVALHIYQTYRILNRQDGKQLLTLVSYKGQEHIWAKCNEHRRRGSQEMGRSAVACCLLGLKATTHMKPGGCTRSRHFNTDGKEDSTPSWRAICSDGYWMRIFLWSSDHS